MLSSTMSAALVQPSSQLQVQQRNQVAVQPFRAAAGLRCERLGAVPAPCRALLWGLCCTAAGWQSAEGNRLLPWVALVQAQRQPAARGGAPQQRRPGGEDDSQG